MQAQHSEDPPHHDTYSYESSPARPTTADKADEDDDDEELYHNNAPVELELVSQAAEQIASVLNNLKRDLDNRDGTAATVRGRFELSVDAQAYELNLVDSEEGDEFPLTVEARILKGKNASNGAVASPPVHKPMRRPSDAELEKDLVSRKRARHDQNEDEDASNKRQRFDEEEDVMPLITKEDLQDIVATLREDIQEDTSECVNHVQKLLRRFKEEWHEQQTRPPPRSPIVDSTPTIGASFPTPAENGDSQGATLPDMIRRESKLISNQIRWVEECRRVAHESHDKREDNWRTTSASFHDRARQDREDFQNRMLREAAMQAQRMDQILNEVRSIGLYSQSMKWETPASMSNQGHPPQHVSPYPPQPSQHRQSISAHPQPTPSHPQPLRPTFPTSAQPGPPQPAPSQQPVAIPRGPTTGPTAGPTTMAPTRGKGKNGRGGSQLRWK
jgi:hypothetical protein